MTVLKMWYFVGLPWVAKIKAKPLGIITIAMCGIYVKSLKYIGIIEYLWVLFG